jgi:hypothetical protein
MVRLSQRLVALAPWHASLIFVRDFVGLAESKLIERLFRTSNIGRLRYCGMGR